MITPTSRQLEMLQHALGLDEHGQPPHNYRGSHDDKFPGCYRNHYVTNPAGPDGRECEKMVKQGWMSKPMPQPGFIGSMITYSVTPDGYEMVRKHSKPLPKTSRSKQRYQDYLASDGVFPSFRHYLKSLQTNKSAIA
jgi:hypothetical protein